MVAYHYDFRIALVKGSPNAVAANATVLVYDPLDTGMTTPAAVYSNPGMTTIINLVTDAHGVVPDFWSERPDLLWKSGTYSGGWATTSSRPGLRGPSGGMGPAGPAGPQGAPGLNGAGTNAEVAAFIPSSGPTRDALDARYTPTESLDAATAGKINAPGSATSAALNATYAKKAGVNLADFATLKDAIAALPANGGTVTVPIGRFTSGNWTYDTDYMSKPNVRIIGEKMPNLSANADRLENGSVIQGRFNAFAHGFEVSNVGFDVGKYVTDTYYGGNDTHAGDHPNGGGWDAFAFAQPNMGAPIPARRGCHFTNLIGLTRDSQSYGHAVLMEGVDGGTADGVIGVGAIHAVVVKSRNMEIGSLRGWAGSVNNVIFKADSYAACGHNTAESVESLRVPPNTAPWFTPAIAQHGLLLNPSTASFDGPTQIGKLKVFGAYRGLAIDGNPDNIVADVQINEFMADGYTGTMTSGIDFWTCRAMRIQINSLMISNATQGISWAPANSNDNGNHQLTIGSAQITNMSSRAINAALNAKVRIGTLEVSVAGATYYCDDSARIMVGKETLISAGTKWERTPPALVTGWSDFGGGNSTWEVKLENYGVTIKGLLAAGAGATATIASLPAYLRPAENKRIPGYRNKQSVSEFALIGVDSGAAGVSVNNGTAPLVGDYFSLDGVSWQHW